MRSSYQQSSSFHKNFPSCYICFLFILINNWLGLLPIGGLGLLEKEKGVSFYPILRGGTADINTTMALAVMAVIGANIFGILSIGIWKTFNKYVNLKALGGIFTKLRKEPTVIIVAPITFFVGIIEIISEFAKIASLSFRLFEMFLLEKFCSHLWQLCGLYSSCTILIPRNHGGSNSGSDLLNFVSCLLYDIRY